EEEEEEEEEAELPARDSTRVTTAVKSLHGRSREPLAGALGIPWRSAARAEHRRPRAALRAAGPTNHRQPVGAKGRSASGVARPRAECPGWVKANASAVRIRLGARAPGVSGRRRAPAPRLSALASPASPYAAAPGGRCQHKEK
ncbi:unnamed protein product, partial [Prorocentrum cordatum]